MQKDILQFLYIERKLTPFEISEITSTNIDDIINDLINYDIDKNPTRKKYRLIRKNPLTSEQKELIVGEIISGAKLCKHGKNNLRLIISSKSKQKILWKKMLLGNFVNVINEKNGKYSISIIHDELNTLQKFLYEENKTKKKISNELEPFISDVTLSSLFINCGFIKNETIRLSINTFDKYNIENFQFLLKLKFNIKSKVCEYEHNGNKRYYLSINKENTKIFFDKIKYVLGFYNRIFGNQILNDYMQNTNNSDDIV